MKVSEIMNTHLLEVGPESTLGEAATLMGERKVGSVLVTDRDRLVGIITERDIVRALSNTFDAPLRPVVEWMTKGPRTVTPDVEVRVALRTMVDGGFRHLPVADGERVIGMLSMRDVATSMAD